MKLVGIFILIFLSLYLMALKGNGEDDDDVHRESKIDLLWEDESLDGSRWTVETFSDSRSVPPLPESDSDDKYLRVKLDSSVFGVAILRSSVFTARPGDRFSFSYFVSSKAGRPLTNLQLSFATLDKKQKLLVDIRSIIPEKVEEWQTISGLIPVEFPTELTLLFHGFCGDSDNDVVLIDEMSVDSNGLPSSSEATVPSYSTETTPETTTSTALTFTSEILSMTSSSVCTASSGSATLTDGRSSSTLMMTTSTPTPTTSPPELKCPNGQVYDPCSCDGSTADTMSILCDRIAFDVVSSVFSGTTATNISLLTLRIIENTIPANLTAGSSLKAISIECFRVGQRFPEISIDNDALSSSTKYMKTLKISNCGLNQLDFSFLNGFTKLAKLEAFDCVGFFSSWSTLPNSLSELSDLTLTGIKEENEEINFLSPQFTGLVEIHIGMCSLSDPFVGAILDALAASASISANILGIDNNADLTSIPPQINSFRRLKNIELHGNKQLRTIGPNAFNFSYITNFYLDDCYIETIDPNAFTGVTTKPGVILISLRNNQLKRLEYESFWPPLQMLFDSGSIDVMGNPFDCTMDPCHLAWIIRDHREQLGKFWNAVCSNGTKFSDLDPAFFDQCPPA